MSSYLPPSITKAIESLACLPGIGSKSAERLVFSLLKSGNGLEEKIADSLRHLKANVGECQQCHHYCELNLETKELENLGTKNHICPICNASTRDQNVICVVSESSDLVALEKTHEFNGLYHVLHGVISPVNKVRPENLRIRSLLERINQNQNPDGKITEIILALSGDMESETTALYLYDQLKNTFDGNITRLSRGIPASSNLEYLDVGTLTRAMSERRAF
ncbi:MAG TPA: recombination mediator RecR [Candidatus Gracilibacteria bacterium]